MKLLPIVPGCRAIIIESKVPSNLGISCVVVKYVGVVDMFHGQNRWIIDKTTRTVLGRKCNHVREEQLLRIDGGDFSKETESVTEKVREKAR